MLQVTDLLKQRNFFLTLIDKIAATPISSATLSLLAEQVSERLTEITLEHSYLEACSCRSLFRQLLNQKFKALAQGKKEFYDVIFKENTHYVHIQ